MIIYIYIHECKCTIHTLCTHNIYNDECVSDCVWLCREHRHTFVEIHASLQYGISQLQHREVPVMNFLVPSFHPKREPAARRPSPMLTFMPNSTDWAVRVHNTPISKIPLRLNKSRRTLYIFTSYCLVQPSDVALLPPMTIVWQQEPLLRYRWKNFSLLSTLITTDDGFIVAKLRVKSHCVKIALTGPILPPIILAPKAGSCCGGWNTLSSGSTVA
jgi:hypothetical protein